MRKTYIFPSTESFRRGTDPARESGDGQDAQSFGLWRESGVYLCFVTGIWRRGGTILSCVVSGKSGEKGEATEIRGSLKLSEKKERRVKGRLKKN